ncbi:MAG TPA: YraN family protein [Thermoanaerobacterales bacterium]|jgi:putative endonuclease|nr:YraN family protein [Thermoanaerobacterales bacterium]
MDRKQLGKLGEQKAVDFFKKNRYSILFVNYRCRFGEIDIIAKKEGTIVFVEVKTRRSDSFGMGMEAVNYPKQQKIRKTALNFLNENKIRFENLRFDVIDIFFDGRSFKLNHIKNSF